MFVPNLVLPALASHQERYQAHVSQQTQASYQNLLHRIHAQKREQQTTSGAGTGGVGVGRGVSREDTASPEQERSAIGLAGFDGNRGVGEGPVVVDSRLTAAHRTLGGQRARIGHERLLALGRSRSQQLHSSLPFQLRPVVDHQPGEIRQEPPSANSKGSSIESVSDSESEEFTTEKSDQESIPGPEPEGDESGSPASPLTAAQSSAYLEMQAALALRAKYRIRCRPRPLSDSHKHEIKKFVQKKHTSTAALRLRENAVLEKFTTVSASPAPSHERSATLRDESAT
mmetsp:Transcript_17262/g.37517  ORF Transcript_17262/g.37517 Transcript_17262/m.37517 type:complete len:286 (+) Transcript_17262:71-928(+)